MKKKKAQFRAVPKKQKPDVVQKALHQTYGLIYDTLRKMGDELQFKLNEHANIVRSRSYDEVKLRHKDRLRHIANYINDCIQDKRSPEETLQKACRLIAEELEQM